MISIRKLTLTLTIVLAAMIVSYSSDSILVLHFDCQGKSRKITSEFADSLKANLNVLSVPVVQRSRWTSLLNSSGYNENDMNYNPPVLSRLVGKLGAKGAVYGQVYEKDGMLILDAYYIEPDAAKPIDIDPMLGYENADILEMSWNLAVIISQEDKVPPSLVRVEPPDSSVIHDHYVDFKLYFDEPMNPEGFGITGEPRDMFFTVGDYKYDESDNSFTIRMHLYPGKEYKFWVNGPGSKPFMDTYGNVARPFHWRIFTK